MKICPVLLLGVFCLFPVVATGQSFGKCEKLLDEVLWEFNRSFEEQNPHLLKAPDYRKKLKRLTEAYEAYRRMNYSPSDSAARVSNESLLLALSGDYARAARLVKARDQSEEQGYHEGLLLQLAGDSRAIHVLSKHPDQPGGGINRLYSAALDPSIKRLNISGKDVEGKLSYNSGILARREGDFGSAFRLLSRALDETDKPLYRRQRGDAYLASGNPEKALEDYRALDRKDPSTLIRFGMAHRNAGRSAEAILFLKEYVRTHDKTYAGQACLGIADAYYAERNYEEARRYYSKAARYKELRLWAACGEANIHLAGRRYQSAKNILDRVIASDSTFLHAYLARGIAQFGLKNYTAALADFRGAEPLVRKGSREIADVLVCRGYSHYHTGDTGLARADFEKAVQLDPGRYEALAGLGKIAIDQRKYPEAGKYLSEALKYKKDYDRLWANYGNLLLHFNMFEKAHVVFRNATQLNPRNLQAHNGLGITILEKDRLQEARHLFDSLIRTNPGKPFLLNNRGIVHAYLGNRFSQFGEKDQADLSYRESETDFDLAMELAPAKKFYHVNRGNVFRYWQCYEDARLSYQAYQDKSALNNTAVLLAGLENLKDASYYLGVAIQIDSTHRVFQYNRNVMMQGKAKEMARFVASARDSGPFSEISLKYSLDGYVTIYLYDYEYAPMEFDGRHHLPLPERNLLNESVLIPHYDFTLLPYSGAKTEKSAKQKSSKMPRLRKGKSRSGTKCPVF